MIWLGNELRLWNISSYWIYGEYVQFFMNTLNSWWKISTYGKLDEWLACSLYGEHAHCNKGEHAHCMVNMLIAWQTCSLYVEHTHCMVNMLYLCILIWQWKSSIYDEYPQFIVNMLKLWCTCLINGAHVKFMVHMLNLWCICSIYGAYAQFMVQMLNL